MKIFCKMLRSLLAVFCLSAFVSVGNCALAEGKIIRADGIRPVRTELRDADANTLVVFDCNGVLLVAEDALLTKNNFHFAKEWYDSSDRELSFLDLMCKVMTLSKDRLVNPKMPKLVRNLQRKNIKALVLTGFSSKPFAFGNVRNPAEWRSMVLNDFGYHFENFWPDLDDRHFDELGDPYDPSFCLGVICVGNISKAKALEAFLNYAEFQPKKIIFIDDSEKNLNEVLEWAKLKDIEFIGIYYTEADKIAPLFPFSRERAQLQLDTLDRENRWLSDGEAEQILQKQ